MTKGGQTDFWFLTLQLFPFFCSFFFGLGRFVSTSSLGVAAGSWYRCRLYRQPPGLGLSMLHILSLSQENVERNTEHCRNRFKRLFNYVKKSFRNLGESNVYPFKRAKVEKAM